MSSATMQDEARIPRAVNLRPSPGTTKPENARDVQVGGDHYKGGGIQPIEFCHSNGLDFFQGSVIKYIFRFRKKNGLQDLLKARHYIDLLIENEYPGVSQT